MGSSVKTKKKPQRLQVWLILLGIAVLAAGLLIFFLTRDDLFETTTFSMGTYVTQRVYGKNREEGAQLAAQAVAELDDLISWRDGQGDVAAINEAAGKEFVSVDPRTEQVLRSAMNVCEKSGGALDITIAPISRLWDFDDNPHLPADDMIQKFLTKVDYSALSLPGDGTVGLRLHETAIDLGAVGKGAGCDVAVAAYQQAGVSRAVVAVGGSIGVYGSKPFGEPWKIAVRDPMGDGLLGTLSLTEGFLSTSGSYEKFFTENGKTYHHLLDPSTGYPAESGLVSVTIKSSEGALSDGLSTACCVLGMEKSLPLLKEFGAEAIFVTEDGQVRVTAGIWADFSLIDNGFYTAKMLPDQ